MLFSKNKKDFTEINNYGLIGNLKTTALISMHGSIDFMCFPAFDSPTVFCATLDQEEGGCFSIKPDAEDVRYKQLYLTDTAILVTRFFVEQGLGELTDFMVVDEKEGKLTLVRKVISIRGNINFTLDCQPRFGYGKTKHKAEQDGNGVVFASKENETIYLNSTHEIALTKNDAEAKFTLQEGEEAWFFLTDYNAQSFLNGDVKAFGNILYRTTFDYWKDWIDQSSFKGRWIETVLRSAITLKLLSSSEYGSVVAAPTFGLPENIGGDRNWDYRYAWIRDSAFTMYAFMKLGFKDEATHFLQWIDKYCISGEMKLVYTYDGRQAPEEENLKHLSGYMNSKPVRIGNNAYKQTQLDIYGELIDTIYIYNRYGGDISKEFWEKLCKHIEYISDHWEEPDHGIWEVRGGKKEFLHSRLMCWVALDRGIRIAEKNGFAFDKNKWYSVREAIHDNIHKHFWCKEKKAFVQTKDSTELDASVMLMPLVHFIDIHDEKWEQTLAAIERELKLDVLIYRYRTDTNKSDGLDGEEGTFTMCSFWYIECLARAGRYKEASENFAKIIGYGNPLRLFSEQVSKHGEQVGNFPQALTHLALINAGIELSHQFEINNPHKQSMHC